MYDNSKGRIKYKTCCVNHNQKLFSRAMVIPTVLNIKVKTKSGYWPIRIFSIQKTLLWLGKSSSINTNVYDFIQLFTISSFIFFGKWLNGFSFHTCQYIGVFSKNLSLQPWIIKTFITCIIRTSGSLKFYCLVPIIHYYWQLVSYALTNIYFLRLLVYICCFMRFRTQDDSNSFFLYYQNFIHISFNLP